MLAFFFPLPEPITPIPSDKDSVIIKIEKELQGDTLPDNSLEEEYMLNFKNSSLIYDKHEAAKKMKCVQNRK